MQLVVTALYYQRSGLRNRREIQALQLYGQTHGLRGTQAQFLLFKPSQNLVRMFGHTQRLGRLQRDQLRLLGRSHAEQIPVK